MSEAKISSKILRPWPVNTTCKVEIDKNLCRQSRRACFALNGQPYLCDRKTKMSQLSRKISDEITGNSTSKSQKNSRTGDMAGAGSGQQERMQVRPGSVGAYGYGKCNEGSWSVDRTHRRLRHRFILQGVPHRSDRPILNHGAGLRTLTSQPLNTEGIISEEVFDLHTTRSEKVRQTRYRCRSDNKKSLRMA